MSSKRTLPLRKRVAFCLVLGLLLLLLLEGGAWVSLRLLYSDTRPISLQETIYQPHANIGYSLRPHVRKEDYADGHLEINSDGYRGPEISKSRPQLRIVCLGGSTTFSITVGNDTTYPRLLEKKLRASYPGSEIEVINAGVGAYTSAESLANLAYRVLQIEPDVLIIYHAVNDVHPRITPGFRGDYSHYRKSLVLEEDLLARVQRWSYLARLLNRVRFQSIHIRHLTTHTKFEDIHPDAQANHFQATNASAFRRNIESMIGLARVRDIDVVLSTFTHSEDNLRAAAQFSHEAYSAGIRQHNEVMQELSAEHQLLLVDLAEQFPSDRTDVFKGTVHMTSVGTDIKAQIFHDQLVKSKILERHLERSAE